MNSKPLLLENIKNVYSHWLTMPVLILANFLIEICSLDNFHFSSFGYLTFQNIQWYCDKMNYNILPFSLNHQHTPYEKLSKTSILYYFISQILKKNLSHLCPPNRFPKNLLNVCSWVVLSKETNRQDSVIHLFFHRSQMTQISKQQISISCSCALIGPMVELYRARKGSWGHWWYT